MLPLIYTQITYRFLFSIAFVVWATSELLGPARWHGTRDAEKRDQGSLAVGLISGITGSSSIFCFLSGSLRRRFPGINQQYLVQEEETHPVARFAGGVLVLLAVGWRWYALLTLGRYYTGIVALHPDQPVIQHGPFKLVRHPSYLEVLLIILGIGLMVENCVTLGIK